MAKVVVCTACETVDDSRTRVKGSFLIEVVLWLFFIVPGLIYSLWRLTTRATVCGACGSELLVPLSSPAGRRIVEAADAEHQRRMDIIDAEEAEYRRSLPPDPDA